MKWSSMFMAAVWLCAAVSGGGRPGSRGPAAALELYGNFHSLGVIASLAAGEDPDGDAQASLEYRLPGGEYQAAFPLSRVRADRFAGSLFWLQPYTSYEVRVTLADPDGGALEGVVLQSSAATRREPALPAASHTYYASPQGGGSACTLAEPCGLANGLQAVQPGQELVLLGGVYYQGDFTLPRSGVEGAPIVIRGQVGETAVLDGGDPAVFTWTLLGGGVYQSTVNIGSPHLAAADGQRLAPYTSLADLQNLAWSVPGFYAQGTQVYLRLAGDADPNQAHIVVSRYNTAFTIEQDFIYIANLTFRHYGQGDYAKAIYLSGASSNLVQGCTFALNDLGIGFKYGSGRNLVQDNLFYDTVYDWPWDAFYSGIDMLGSGLSFYSPVSGRGNVIRRNVFHDFFDGFDACPEETGGETNETDIYQNLVYRAGDDGMETDGECSNVRIWGNTFHDVLVGISLAPVYTGPVYALRNLVYRTGQGNNDYTGTPFKFNSGYNASGPMYLFHNTADAVMPGNNGLYIKAPGEWALIQARNNIWAGTDAALDNYNTGQPVDLDYDDLWTSSAPLVRWDSSSYDSLAAFSAASGQEAHGLNLEPGFRYAPGGDYALDSLSPLVDQGLFIPGINDGFSGAAPDLGAFELGGAGPLLRLYLPLAMRGP